MKLLPKHLNASIRCAGLNRQILPRLLPSSLMAMTLLAGAGFSSAQSLQSAGDLILNLQSVDLNSTSVWTNQTLNANSVGNLATRSASPLNVVSIAYGAGSINALYVNGTVGNALQSLNQAPSEILGNAPFSGEAWIYADNLNGQDVMSYGFEGGSAAPDEVRDMGFFNAGYGAFTGNFGNSDSGWNPPATAGVLHYVAWTYDGSNTRVYQDGVLSGTGGGTLNTQPSLLDVGCNVNGQSPLNGYIAAARLESGVLSDSQISNNFSAGPLATFGLVANKPFVSPGTHVFVGDVVTFTELAQAGEALTFQWYSDNGTGATFTPISGQTGTNYVLDTSTLPGAGTYQYEVVVTGGTTVTSPPVSLVVSAASAPVVSQNTTPLSPGNIYVGADLSFSAAFVGNQTISYQWQKSVNNGATFQDVAGATTSTLSLTNLQVSDSGQYRLHASNGLGSGNSTPAILTVLATRPPLQIAGELLVNLQSSDLNTNGNIWTNEINGMGDFVTVNDADLSVTNLIYNHQPIQVLVVNQIQGNSVQSLNNVPDVLLGNSTYSAEAWVYATSGTASSYEVAYGVDGGGGAPHEAREMGYFNQGYAGFTGNFGPDVGWSTTPTVGWHYLACTFDGSTVQLYQDGQPNGSAGGTLSTPQTLMWIGSSVLGGNPFAGYIASARVQSGVLTAGQVANNFASGPSQTISIVVGPAMVAPGSTVFIGDSVTLSVTNVQSLESLTYQWQTDNGSSGTAWSNIAGATSTNYSFTATTAAANEYQLVVTGVSGVASSAPVTLTIKPQASPTVSADTSPASAYLFVGQQAIFSAAFTGNQPITNQWQISTNGGSTFQNIAGQTGNTLALTNVQLTDSAEYRLLASNAFGKTNSTLASLTVLPVSSEPQIATAGDVIVNLEPADLDTNAGVWHNESTSTNSVGDFTFAGTTGPLNVATVTYNSQPVNVLNVAGVGGNSVEAITFPAPAILLGANPCTMEAWVFATQVANNNTVINYGDQTSQSGNLDRAFNYQTQGFGAFTGYFGNADLSWNPAATANVWHYIVMTYDGNTLSVYQDAALNNSRSGIILATDESYISVGSGTGGGPFAGADPFSGYIASARVETGVLTPAQITQNFAAGPGPGLGTANIQKIAPLHAVFSGGKLTLSWAAGTLQESANLNGPWTTDSGVQSPLVIANTAGIPIKFYRLNYSMPQSGAGCRSHGWLRCPLFKK